MCDLLAGLILFVLSLPVIIGAVVIGGLISLAYAFPYHMGAIALVFVGGAIIERYKEQRYMRRRRAAREPS